MGVSLYLTYDDKYIYCFKITAYPLDYYNLLPNESDLDPKNLKYYKYWLYLMKLLAKNHKKIFDEKSRSDITIEDIEEDIKNVQYAISFYRKNKNKHKFKLSLG